MTEWTVLTVIIAVVGLIATVTAPLIKFNNTVTKLTTVVTMVQKNFDSMTTDNTESHRRIWGELDEQGGRINDHETRITVVEHTLGGKK